MEYLKTSNMWPTQGQTEPPTGELGLLIMHFYQCPKCGAKAKNSAESADFGRWNTFQILCCGHYPKVNRLPHTWQGAYFTADKSSS